MIDFLFSEMSFIKEYSIGISDVKGTFTGLGDADVNEKLTSII